MLRKVFRRLLPPHDSIRGNRYIARLGPRLQHHNLWHLHRRSVAGGVAAGLFAGLVPGSNPVQFAVAALIAVAARVNLPLAVIVTMYSNPFTVLPLYYLAFELGQLVLLQGHDAALPLPPSLEGRGLREWLGMVLEWLLTTGKPIAVGLPLLAISLAGAGYLLVHSAWRLSVRCAWSRRRRRRRGS